MSSCVLHNKNNFTLLGFSMLPILLEEVFFEKKDGYKVPSCTLKPSDMTEKYKYPLLIDMRDRIENFYGLRVQKLVLSLLKEKDTIDDIDHINDSLNSDNLFLINIGGKRTVNIKNTEIEYLMEDGDLLFLNKKSDAAHSYCISENTDKEKLSIMITIYC